MRTLAGNLLPALRGVGDRVGASLHRLARGVGAALRPMGGGVVEELFRLGHLLVDLHCMDVGIHPRLQGLVMGDHNHLRRLDVDFDSSLPGVGLGNQSHLRTLGLRDGPDLSCLGPHPRPLVHAILRHQALVRAE